MTDLKNGRKAGKLFAKLEKLTAEHNKLIVELSALVSARLGCNADVVTVAGDGLCIDLSYGFGGLTLLSVELLDSVFACEKDSAIAIIKARSV
jgi:hypothetical protein